jgi:hypothetical protein
MVFYFFCMQISCLEMSACCLYSFCKIQVFFTFCTFSFAYLTICLPFICLPVLYASLSVYLPTGFSSYLQICVPVHFLPFICLPVQMPPDHLPPYSFADQFHLLSFIWLIARLPTCLFLPTCPSTYLSISAYLSSCLPVYLSTCPSTYPPHCLPAYLRFCLSTCLTVQA